MATIGSSYMTLADAAKLMDPQGKAIDVVELLSLTNPVLEEMLFKEGNLPTGEQLSVRTGLPTVAWRMAYQGVAVSKSTTAQVTEGCGLLTGRYEIDRLIADLNGNTAAFRASEAKAFTSAMNNEMASTLFYGNSGSAPEEFTGLAPRYSSLSAANGQNIISAGGSGSDNSSVFLVGWGDPCYGVYPKGSKAGLVREDLGLIDAFDASNNRFRAYAELWEWKMGLALKDWRYVVRIPNIDMSDLASLATTQATTASTFLPKLMSRALDRIPSPNGVKLAFYARRDVISLLRVAAMEKSTSAVTIEEGLNQFGQTIHTTKFLGIPVRPSDALIITESVVA